MQNALALKEEILALKREKGAIILAHNYIDGKIQDVADFVGDSLELSVKARDNEADIIVFCGVRFMAETAKILSPKATVLMPNLNAGCPMADNCDPVALAAYRANHPDTTIIAYVNTTAATKSLVDICCTSGNAEKIVQSVASDKDILFLPDHNLGANLNKKLGVNMILWKGCCPVHHALELSSVRAAKEVHPESPILVHLECQPEIVELADAALSTRGILDWAAKSDAKSFIIGTEEGMLYRLRKENPHKTFYGLEPALICPDMKVTTLQQLRDSLKYEQYPIELDEEVMKRALVPIQRMLELS
ncbi:MAG: quinolinate synthase NadA [Bradymonadales bacterium]